jgi:putative transposase
MDVGERATWLRFVIRDRNSKFTAAFDDVPVGTGVRIIKTPVHSPRADAMRSGCARRPDQGRRPDADLRRTPSARALVQYEAHCDGRRPHRSRQLQPSVPDHPVASSLRVLVKRRAALAGRLNEYEQTAQKAQLNHSGRVLEADSRRDIGVDS